MYLWNVCSKKSEAGSLKSDIQRQNQFEGQKGPAVGAIDGCDETGIYTPFACYPGFLRLISDHFLSPSSTR